MVWGFPYSRAETSSVFISLKLRQGTARPEIGLFTSAPEAASVRIISVLPENLVAALPFIDTAR